MQKTSTITIYILYRNYVPLQFLVWKLRFSVNYKRGRYFHKDQDGDGGGDGDGGETCIFVSKINI